MTLPSSDPINMLARMNMTVKAKSRRRIHLKYHVNDGDMEQMIQEGTWYVLHDAEQSRATIPTGLTQAATQDEDSSGAWVWMDNHATKDIHIKPGDTVAIATPEVPGTFEVRGV